MSSRNLRRPNERASCEGKRRYRTEGEALEAAALVGVERHRVAYLCPACLCWHLATARKPKGADWRHRR